jgi:hypothetical protein
MTEEKMLINKKIKSNLIVILSLCFIVFSTVVYARAFRTAVLPDKGANFGCATCHNSPNGGGARNSFGIDYEKIAIPAGDKYTDALAKLDSDKDGFTNEQEFSANPVTNPGDPNSHPPIQQAVNIKGKIFGTWGKIKSIK